MKNSVIQTTINKLRAGDKFGSALGKGFSIGASQAITGGFMGGISGGIRAKGYGGDFWTGRRPKLSVSGRLNISSSSKYIRLKNNDNLIASTDIKSLSFSTPGQIDWNNSMNKKGVHLFKWIRYENTFDDGVLDMNSVFDNYNKYSHGYSGKDIKAILNGERIRAYLNIGIIKETSIDVSFGKIVNVDMPNGEVWNFMKGPSYRWGTHNKNFDLLFNYLGYN